MGIKDMMKSFLFETVDSIEDDDEDVVEETTEEPVEEQPAAAEPVSPAVHETPAPAVLEPVTPAEVDRQANDFLASTSRKPESSLFAGVEETLSPSTNSSSQTARSHAKKTEAKKAPAQARKGASRKDKTAFIDYSAVLSPIFGNLPEDQKDVDAVHDAINLPEPQDHSDMIQIISPMYGTTPKPKKRAPLGERRSAAPKAAAEAPAKEAEKAAPAHEAAQASAAARTNTNRTRLTDELLSNAAAASNTHSKPMDLAAYLSRPARTSSKDGDKE
ncbi:hypothetical protein [Allobaculum fili]|uniref:hypothetical protein n=1 Tax=Allobaculum fili TaxID=2834460 RepID=UPI001E57C886|nr:hypothetical protein [Allobaculum fili]